MRLSTRRTWLMTLVLFVSATGTVIRAAGDDRDSEAVRGFLAPDAKARGYSLTDLATAYMAWASGTPAPVNPLLAVRCEQSPIDPRIWFLPVSLGGEQKNICYVPHGSFLVLTPGAFECSEAEGNGSTPAELTSCVDAGFDLLDHVEVTFRGKTTTDLQDYVVTTDFDVLPPDNLNGPNATPTMTKGYFMVLKPLSRGRHTLHAFDTFSFGFAAGITYTIVVR